MSANSDKKKTQASREDSFIMGDGDRFHSIIVSDTVRFDTITSAEAVITFFAIRRANGSYEIVNVNKTYANNKCISRNVHEKTGISAETVGDEINNLCTNVSVGVKQGTGITLKWHTLDLSGIEDIKEQISRIRAWNRVGVISPYADLPEGINLN